uniref:Uncharacterized protein n=1 Tax=Zea mays TaxID=4577 RepID=C4J693_MAIZE|nr:unknown [Zea mays]
MASSRAPPRLGRQHPPLPRLGHRRPRRRGLQLRSPRRPHRPAVLHHLRPLQRAPHLHVQLRQLPKRRGVRRDLRRSRRRHLQRRRGVVAAPAGEGPDAHDRPSVSSLHGAVQSRQGGEEPPAIPRAPRRRGRRGEADAVRPARRVPEADVRHDVHSRLRRRPWVPGARPARGPLRARDGRCAGDAVPPAHHPHGVLEADERAGSRAGEEDGRGSEDDRLLRRHHRRETQGRQAQRRRRRGRLQLVRLAVILHLPRGRLE